MTRWNTLSVGILGALALIAADSLAPAGARGQSGGVEVTTPPPEAPRFRLEPAMPSEQRGSREQEFYPGRVRSRHEPAFVLPLVATARVSHGTSVRWGLSGWTAPAVPFDIPQATGGVAFGLTLTWGPPEEGEAAPAPGPAPGR